MAHLINPTTTAAYERQSRRIVVTLRSEDADWVVLEFDPKNLPPLINALMQARAISKRAGQPSPPPPAPRPPSRPVVLRPEQVERTTYHLDIPPMADPDTVPIRRARSF
jgi:hypothetical protein